MGAVQQETVPIQDLAAKPSVESMTALLAALQASDVHLLVPDDDVLEPVVSIVIPALNEELTICEFVAWCQTGLETAGVRGSILIIHSSTDSTPEKALASGARVLKTP